MNIYNIYIGKIFIIFKTDSLHFCISGRRPFEAVLWPSLTKG